jgi:hypothetical protein
MIHALTRKALVALVLASSLVYVAGCGKSVSGKYADDTGLMAVEFKSDGKATVTIGGTAIDATYTVDGKNVSVKAGADVKAFTINDDGSLSGGGDTLKKK